ncbi:MAG: hypothetical protein M0R06_06885 [Sphaerochaeta sp.]|jgi:hypothetical protein|nr:hypothetical protein [Sphaerochaeta sp.]
MTAALSRLDDITNQTMLKLDMATLKSDHPIKAMIIRHVLRPIGYHFRKRNYNKHYR